MKYKNIDLELPPLGEILMIEDVTQKKTFGYFYLEENKKEFHSLLSNDYIKTENILYWAYLPKFNLIKETKSPIGIMVIMSYINKNGNRLYYKGINVKNYLPNFDGCEADSWIELEKLQRE